MFKVKYLKATLTAVAVAASMVVFDGCKNDTEEVFPAPTITLPTAAGQGTPGSPGSFSATINAPAGLQTVTVSGAQNESKTYLGETSATYSTTYAIPATAAVGSTITYVITATDVKGQNSAAATYVVTVGAIPNKPVITVTGSLTGNQTWTAGNIYKLSGYVRVGVDPTQAGTPTATGSLTIAAGTVIVGERSSKGTLIVQRGSTIYANGTAAAPIVFTSERAVGERESGDWGGLVICGRALNNLPGGTAQLEGGYAAFHGGTQADDNSGVLRYVRVEYAGIPINPNQEVNTFTFGSVGSGTTMEYLQASFGNDDSFEWFGGSTNGKYLIAYRGLDDDFDMDNGFVGNLQFLVGLRGSTLADQSGSNGFEVDNDGSGTANTPFTAPTISNASLIGPKVSAETSIDANFQNGMHLRRNTQIKVYNTIVTGYPNGIYIDGTNTQANAAAGSLILNRVVVAGTAGWGTNGFGAGAGLPNGFGVRDLNTAATPVAITVGDQPVSTWFTGQPGNTISATYAGLGLGDVFATRPALALGATGTLTTGGTVPTGAFFTAAAYIGAFGTTDWTAGWSNFTPQTTNYSR